MSPRNPLTTFITSFPATGPCYLLWHLLSHLVNQDFFRHRTRHILREEEPNTDNPVLFLCPNANLSFPISASIHLLKDSFLTTLSRQHTPPTIYYGIQLIFFTAKLQTVTRSLKLQPQPTFPSFWQNLPVQLSMTVVLSTHVKVESMCGNTLM